MRPIWTAALQPSLDRRAFLIWVLQEVSKKDNSNGRDRIERFENRIVQEIVDLAAPIPAECCAFTRQISSCEEAAEEEAARAERVVELARIAASNAEDIVSRLTVVNAVVSGVDFGQGQWGDEYTSYRGQQDNINSFLGVSKTYMVDTEVIIRHYSGEHKETENLHTYHGLGVLKSFHAITGAVVEEFVGEFKDGRPSRFGRATYWSENGELIGNRLGAHRVHDEEWSAAGEEEEGEERRDKEGVCSVFTHDSGETFHGLYMGGEPKLGRCTMSSGRILEGGFQSGRMILEGTGREVLATTRYEGNYENGLRHGEGKYWYESRDVYTGEWRGDCREGLGQLVHPDGTVDQCQMWDADREFVGEVYVGETKNGTINGRGRLTRSDGSVLEGYWHQGTLVREEELLEPPPKQSEKHV